MKSPYTRQSENNLFSLCEDLESFTRNKSLKIVFHVLASSSISVKWLKISGLRHCNI